MVSGLSIGLLVAALLPIGEQQAASTAPRTASRRSIDAFLGALESAIEHGDRSAIAGMVHYPIKVLAAGWIIPVDNRATFTKYYDAVFTDEIKDLIADASSRPHAMKPSDVLSLGKGAIRIMRIDNSYRIIGLALPPASGKVRGARRGTTTVTFSSDQGTAKFAGTLAAGEHESYVVSVRRNELLDVRIDGVRNRDIVARVLNAANTQPVDERAGAGTRVWTGRVSETGDYRIDIVRTAREGDSVLTYALTVSVR